MLKMTTHLCWLPSSQTAKYVQRAHSILGCPYGGFLKWDWNGWLETPLWPRKPPDGFPFAQRRSGSACDASSTRAMSGESNAAALNNGGESSSSLGGGDARRRVGKGEIKSQHVYECAFKDYVLPIRSYWKRQERKVTSGTLVGGLAKAEIFEHRF